MLWHFVAHKGLDLATGIESRETTHGTRLYRARVLVLHTESGEIVVSKTVVFFSINYFRKKT